MTTIQTTQPAAAATSLRTGTARLAAMAARRFR